MSAKPLPDEAETYIRKAKARASPTGQVMEKLNDMKDQEINETLKNIDLYKARKALEEAKQGTGLATNVLVSKLFEGKSVEEINDMLASMSPEAIANLVKLASSLDTNPINQALRQNAQQPQSGNDMLLQYLLKKSDEKSNQGGITMSDVVAIVKLVNEPKGSAVSVMSAPSQQSTTNQVLETIKVVSALNEPVYRVMGAKDKEILDLKLKELESKIQATQSSR